MQDDPDQTFSTDPPRKRAAIEGLAVRSPTSSMRATGSQSPKSSQWRPNSAPQVSRSDAMRSHLRVRRDHLEGDSPHARPSTEGKKLWDPEVDSPAARSVVVGGNPRGRGQDISRAQRLLQTPASSSARAPVNQAPISILGSKPNITTAPSPRDQPASSAKEERRPEARPISQEQLIAEVKGIYAGLVMVERRCIEVDTKYSAPGGAQELKEDNEKWQLLIALHRTLLHEHHDFFLASQHPSASPALRKLASKYAMPARMWRHGIHSFLELLRHCLPHSLDHMLAFIYLAYSMMALLYETVPAFEDTWVECLGDLGRYRMAIEDDDIRDREVWTGVARHWYSKASDKSPTTGRLHHHLAILARPNALQQLFYYAKSLSVAQPFPSARESILTLFDPVLNPGQSHFRAPPFDTAFVKAHAILFTKTQMESYPKAVNEFFGLLDNHIGRVTRKFMEQGYYMAIANSVALLGFGATDNILFRLLSPTDSAPIAPTVQPETTAKPADTFNLAMDLTNRTLGICLTRIGDPNVLPYVHVTLVFLLYISQSDDAMELLTSAFPKHGLATFLNTLMVGPAAPSGPDVDDFPIPNPADLHPLPEDWAMRGLTWAIDYFPDRWFSNEKIEDDEKSLERKSMTEERIERVLFLARRLASKSSWLVYNSDLRQFSSPGSLDAGDQAAMSEIEENYIQNSINKLPMEIGLSGTPLSPISTAQPSEIELDPSPSTTRTSTWDSKATAETEVETEPYAINTECRVVEGGISDEDEEVTPVKEKAGQGFPPQEVVQ
jgi:hypothetical protein